MEEVLSCSRTKLRDHFEGFLSAHKIGSGDDYVQCGDSVASRADFEATASGKNVHIKSEPVECDESPPIINFLEVPIKKEKLDDDTQYGIESHVDDADVGVIGNKTANCSIDQVRVPCRQTTSTISIADVISVKKEKEDPASINREQEGNNNKSLRSSPSNINTSILSRATLVKIEEDDLVSCTVVVKCENDVQNDGATSQQISEKADIDEKPVGSLHTSQSFISNPSQSVPRSLQDLNNDFNQYKGIFSLQECSVKVRRLSEEVLTRYGITLDVAVENKVDVQTLKRGLFSCSECSFRSHRIKELRDHQWQHRTDTAYHQCRECNYRTEWVHCIISHVKRVHRKIKPHKCPYCDYKSATSTALKQHINVHTSYKPLKCPYCNYRAVAQSSLRSHVYTHTGEKPYACPHCSYRCTQYAHLKSHLYVHTREKPYACDLCDYRTTQSTHLRSHVQAVHTDIKPFKCEHCSYASKSLTGLRIHVRKHTGERPFACMLCSYTATQSTSLRFHMRGHCETRRCKCSVCGYSTSTAFSLKTHIASCHASIESPLG